MSEKKLFSASGAVSRIEALLDAGSFVESEPYMSDTGIVWGHGEIDGRPVIVYAQDGAIGLAHAKRIARAYVSAIKVGVPIIGMHDSKGIRLDEGLECLEAFGIILSAQSEASGAVPQISIITGDCIGTNAFVPALSDFRFATGDSRYFFSSPDTYKSRAAAVAMNPDTGLTADSPLIDFYYKNENGLVDGVRDLLAYLPSNCLEPLPEAGYSDSTPLQAVGADLEAPEPLGVVKAVADGGRFIEVRKAAAPGVKTGLMRVAGRTAGFIASGGCMSADTLAKTGEFIVFCDSFGIPIVSFVDAAGFDNTGDDSSFIRNGARVINAYAGASVPKVSVITGNATGAACVLACCGFFPADIVFAWPKSVISPIDPKAEKEIFGDGHASGPEEAAKKGYVSDIIAPEDTRKRLIASLGMLSSKRVSRLTKKHGTILY